LKSPFVLALAVLWSRSAVAVDAKEDKRMDVAKAFRDCALVEKIDVPHGGKLTDAGRERAGSCVALGMAYEEGDVDDLDGRHIEVNYKLALRYYESACGAGIAVGCVSVGQLVEKGQVAPAKGVDVALAASKWYALGCNLPDGEGVRVACFFAGQATLNHAGTKKGKARASGIAAGMRFFQRACELGDDDSCKVVIQAQEMLSKH
jgi:TPR repeat protein